MGLDCSTLAWCLNQITVIMFTTRDPRWRIALRSRNHVQNIDSWFLFSPSCWHGAVQCHVYGFDPNKEDLWMILVNSCRVVIKQEKLWSKLMAEHPHKMSMPFLATLCNKSPELQSTSKLGLKILSTIPNWIHKTSFIESSWDHIGVKCKMHLQSCIKLGFLLKKNNEFTAYEICSA